MTTTNEVNQGLRGVLAPSKGLFNDEYDRVRIGVLGSNNKGKTALLTVSIVGMPNTQQSDGESISIHSLMETTKRFKAARELLLKGESTEATPLMTSSGFDYQLRVNSHGKRFGWDFRSKDYAGAILKIEGMDEKTGAVKKTLSREITAWLTECDGVMILMPCNLPPAEQAECLLETNVLLAELNQSRKEIPVALLINKWDLMYKTGKLSGSIETPEKEKEKALRFLKDNKQYQQIVNLVNDSHGRIEIFPVSAFGVNHDQQDSPNPSQDGNTLNIQPLNIHEPLVWLARQRDEILCEALIEESTNRLECPNCLWPSCYWSAKSQLKKQTKTCKIADPNCVDKLSKRRNGLLAKGAALFMFYLILFLGGIFGGGCWHADSAMQEAISEINKATSIERVEEAEKGFCSTRNPVASLLGWDTKVRYMAGEKIKELMDRIVADLGKLEDIMEKSRPADTSVSEREKYCLEIFDNYKKYTDLSKSIKRLVPPHIEKIKSDADKEFLQVTIYKDIQQYHKDIMVKTPKWIVSDEQWAGIRDNYPVSTTTGTPKVRFDLKVEMQKKGYSDEMVKPELERYVFVIMDKELQYLMQKIRSGKPSVEEFKRAIRLCKQNLTETNKKFLQEILQKYDAKRYSDLSAALENALTWADLTQVFNDANEYVNPEMSELPSSNVERLERIKKVGYWTSLYAQFRDKKLYDLAVVNVNFPRAASFYSDKSASEIVLRLTVSYQLNLGTKVDIGDQYDDSNRYKNYSDYYISSQDGKRGETNKDYVFVDFKKSLKSHVCTLEPGKAISILLWENSASSDPVFQWKFDDVRSLIHRKGEKIMWKTPAHDLRREKQTDEPIELFMYVKTPAGLFGPFGAK